MESKCCIGLSLALKYMHAILSGSNWGKAGYDRVEDDQS